MRILNLKKYINHFFIKEVSQFIARLSNTTVRNIYLKPLLFQKDGTGAQVQRIASVYSAATYLGLGFLHKDITQIDVNPGDGFKSEQQITNFLIRLNNILKRIDDGNKYNQDKKFLKDNLHFYLFLLYKILKTTITRKHYVIEIENCYNLVAARPDILETFGDSFRQSLFNDYLPGKQSFNLHLRSFNLVINNTFLDEVKGLVNILIKNNHIHELTIHTDISESNPQLDLIEKFTSNETKKYWFEKGFEPIKDQRILHSKILHGLIIYCETLGLKVTLARDLDPIEFWVKTINSEYFIMGHSSLSFITAISSNQSKIFVPNSWPYKQSKWETY